MAKVTVEFGEMVTWFPNADQRQIPELGIAKEIHGDIIGHLELLTGPKRTIIGVPHVSDPEATRVPQMTRKLGAWDKLTNYRDQLKRQKIEKEKERDRYQKTVAEDKEKLKLEYLAMEPRILELHDKGLSAVKIAETIQRETRGSRATCSFAIVNKVLTKAGAAAPV